MEQEQNKAQGQFRCGGDCIKCLPIQRQYCAAQWSYNSLRMIEQMQATLNAMQGAIGELKVKIEAIEGNEASLFDPMEEVAQIAQPAKQEIKTAQEGAGAGK